MQYIACRSDTKYGVHRITLSSGQNHSAEPGFHHQIEPIKIDHRWNCGLNLIVETELHAVSLT